METSNFLITDYINNNSELNKDDITKCKKMTVNGLIKPNEELKVHTKLDDEFIVGYFINNELNILKIISVDIQHEKNIIRM